jgi:hypothetical protein
MATAYTKTGFGKMPIRLLAKIRARIILVEEIPTTLFSKPYFGLPTSNYLKRSFVRTVDSGIA